MNKHKETFNLFKNTYFGKLYKTKDGRKAVFLGWSDKKDKVFLYTQERDMEFYGEEMYNLDGTTYKGTTPHDIISEWKEEINEDELDKLASERFCEFVNASSSIGIPNDHFNTYVQDICIEFYKEGYKKKAKEE